MPRSRRTTTGAPAQKVEAVTGQQYGRAKVQEELQQALPTPNETVATPAGAPPSAAPTPRPRMSPEQAMQLVRGAGGVLSAADDNPSIPITDGLATGPGRGPEALSGQSTLGDTLRRLAFQTNDPVFLRLASRIEF